MTAPQYLHLQQLIEDYGCKVVAEVGVWRGNFSVHVLSSCPLVEKMYSIDPYKKWPDHIYVDGKNGHSQKKFDSVYKRTANRLKEFGDRSVLIRDTSVNSAKYIEDEILDLVWIDANHGYEWVKQDIQTWLPKVKKGGILSGDDYLNNFPGVIEAVNEYCFTRDIVLSVIPGGVWYFEKDKVYLRGGRHR